MIIPHAMLSPEALHSVIEAFVTREGTDYGEHDIPLATKVFQVRTQLDEGTAVIVYDHETESCTLPLNWVECENFNPTGMMQPFYRNALLIPSFSILSHILRSLYG